MKIQKYGLGTASILVFIILASYHFFYLFSYSRIMNVFLSDGLYMTIGALALISTVYLYIYHAEIMNDYRGWLYCYCFIVAILFVVFFTYSSWIYPEQKIADSLRCGGRYLYPLLATSFVFLFERDGGTERTFRLLNVLCFLWYIYIILQSFSYSMTGSTLFDFATIGYKIRNNSLRVSTGAFGVIMILYNFVQVYCGKNHGIKKLAFLFQFILGMYCLLAIQQTRAMILICFVCLSIAILLCDGESINRSILKALSVLGIGLFLCFSPYVSDFFATFTADEYQGSSIAREYSVEYFLGVFKNNPLFGYAWATDAANPRILHGASGIAYASDVGIVGLLAEMGLCSILYYIWPLIHMGRILGHIGLKRIRKENIFLVVIFLYTIFTSATMIITDGGKCLAYPLIIALFEYYNNQSSLDWC